MAVFRCHLCKRLVSKSNAARHRRSSQCLLWSLRRGDMSRALQATRASSNYRRMLTRGLSAFQLFLKGNVEMQRTPRRLRAYSGAFVPFCPRAGGMGVGGGVRAFKDLTVGVARDRRLDFFRAGATYLFLKASSVRKLRLARMCVWGVAQKATVKSKLLAMRRAGEQPFNMRILANVYASPNGGTARRAAVKVNGALKILDALWQRAQVL
ncbi:unnamed protein product [Prorocentrum cordatum]|uniref:Uncharacterized protein n=1 Tax=Prorocentrum cordatum TaxID=2364126 RepID=A0ABN9X063_9DINO|nr:unnamed protein product [Polarella glacialis]